MSRLYNQIKEYDIHLIISYSVLVIGLIFVIFRQYELLGYILWCDEAETIVAAKMMASGSTLYSEIFNHHGPLTFFPGYILEQFGSFGIRSHRVFIVLMQWLLLYFIYSTPLIKSQIYKNYFVLGASSYLVVALPYLYGHMYKYQVMAGLLTAILLIRYVLPTIYLSKTVTKTQKIMGPILIASLPFLAIPYLLASILFFLALINRHNYKISIQYLIIGILMNVMFLYLVGSFPGYIADHFYMNTQILPEYSDQLTILNGVVRIVSFFTLNLLGIFIFIIISIVMIKTLVTKDKRIFVNTTLILLGIVSFLFRSTFNFHALPFYYTLLVVPFILFINTKDPNRVIKIVLLVIFLPLVIIGSVLGIKITQLEKRSIPETTEFSELVKKITDKDDKIIAYSFVNHEYIYADRLPASGNFFYLPWQEKYNEKPVFGININSCQDIKMNKPKIMYIDKWKVWSKYTWDSYAKCIQDIIDKDYIQYPGKPFYIRSDLYNQTNVLKIEEK